jgi:hypothetical protein
MKKRTSTISTRETTVPITYEFYGLMTMEELEFHRKALSGLIDVEEDRTTEVWSKRDGVLVKATKAPRFYEEWKKSLEIIEQVITDIKNGDFTRKIKLAEKARKSRAVQHASGAGPARDYNSLV